MRLGQLEINLDELTHFIVQAKKKGYAGGGEKRIEADGSKTFTFQEGNFHYTDNYAGSSQAPGDEIVRWQRENGQRIWHMAYSGGMICPWNYNGSIKEATFAFLKEALMRVSFEHPFRGPLEYENEGFRYECSSTGNIARFAGAEHIRNNELNKTVFSQDFIGGLVIPK